MSAEASEWRLEALGERRSSQRDQIECKNGAQMWYATRDRCTVERPMSAGTRFT